MTSPSGVTEALEPLLEDMLAILPAILLPAIAVWGMTFAFRAFKAVLEVEAPKPRAAVSENYRRQAAEITFTKPEAFTACECPACQHGWGLTAPELTPPTLKDWEGWKRYGLMK